MHPLVEGWSTVIIGIWNIPIFSPEWMSGRLTDTKNIGIEIPINNPASFPRFSFDNIYLRFESNRLILSPREPNEELLQITEKVALKALEELPYTPVVAVGVNFQYVEEDPQGPLLNLFNLSDNSDLSGAGAIVKSTSISRQLDLSGQILRLKVTLRTDDKIVFDLNFHQDVTSAEEAKEHLDRRTVDFHRKGIELLEKAYALEGISKAVGANSK